MSQPVIPRREPVIECVDDDMAVVLRLKTPAQRLQIAFGMWRMAQSIIRARLGQEHPEWSPEQISQEVARRLSHGVV